MKKKVRNPLIRRIPRELRGDWKKYLVVFLFLVLTIGFVSGMYVANESMMTAAKTGVDQYKREDGHFELNKKADASLINAIESGKKADVKAYYTDKAQKELDDKFDSEFNKEFSDKFNDEFEKEFSDQFDSEFKAKFDEQFDSMVKAQFDARFPDIFAEQFRAQFGVEFDKKFMAMTGMQPDSQSPLYQSMYNQAYEQAYAEAYEQAYATAYEEAYQTAKQSQYAEAYKTAYDEAYSTAHDEAYDTAYSEAYEKAYPEAYDEALNKIKDEIDDKYADAEEKYKLDDPDFKEVRVNVYENFFRNEEEDYNNDGTTDGTIRIYVRNDNVNEACLIEGAFPQTSDEIAIDRMHADNVGVKVGDTVTVSGETYRVTGLIAYVNYSTLHEKTTDIMFDAIKFDVAMVTDGGFARLHKTIHYAYAWRYVNKPADDIEEKQQSDNFMRALLTQAVTSDNEIEDYTPAYANPAINFAPDDMGSDEAMGGVLLDILTVIIAFIFAITISNTITKEASTIGTLRASGYTRGELVRHYLSMPVIVTLFAAITGNILGYTVFKNVVVSMYYNSYSLPTYVTIWNSQAFVKSTVIPVIIMLVVNLIIIMRMMRHTPLQFLRHDMKKSKKGKAVRLPDWSFLNRFRIRIMIQNRANYIVLFVGIFFIAVMLAMAVGMPDTLAYYKKNAADMMFTKYQYVLKSYEDDDNNVISTENADAEKFSMTSLLRKGDQFDEEVSVYGVADNSRYVKIDGLGRLNVNEVYISDSFADKYSIKAGDDILLDEKYENKQYTFKVVGIYDKSQSIAVFMPIGQYRSVFGLDNEEFTGYMSDSEITDIAEDDIATVITERDITKMCDQLDHSMGSYMTYFQYLCILLSAVMIYLLTKLIIEKNENAISMTKILGYENKEIAGLYMLSTTIVLVIADIISVILGVIVMNTVWRVMLFSYSGWYAFHFYPSGYAKMFVFILMGYLIVMVLDFNRIRKIPMDKALKEANQE